MQTHPVSPVPRWLTATTWVSRALLWAVLAAWLLVTVLWATLQLWIVPRIGEFRPALEARASSALGVPVQIGQITARSDGLVPSFELQDVRLLDARGQQALRLPTVMVSMTPRSLWRAGFEQVSIERLELDIHRLPNGSVEVAGLSLGQQGGGDNSAALDWFFAQREFVIRGGTVRWTDDYAPSLPALGTATSTTATQKPPPLELRELDLVVRNGSRAHQMRLDATPPAQWGSRFSLRGSFREPLLSAHSGAWQTWTGQMFADFAQVDVSQLRRYASLGVDITAGRGALRLWADVAGGTVQSVASDLALAEVEARLGAGLEPLALQSITGRITVKRTPAQIDFAAERLQFFTRDGLHWPTGNVAVTVREATDKQSAGGELRADALELAALAQIANRLPLGAHAHQALTSLAPKGLVEGLQAQWQGKPEAIGKYSLQATVSQLEIAAQRSTAVLGSGTNVHEAPGRPGLRGARVELRATETGGTARVQISQGALDMPGVFEEPSLPMDQLSADVNWKIAGPRIEVNIPSLKLSNADAQADLKVAWHTLDSATKGGAERFPGTLDIQGNLSRVQGPRVYRYLPLGVPKFTRDYLREALVAGTADTMKIRIRGDVRDMPARTPREGEFYIAGPVNNATFAYAPKLPGQSASREYSNFPALQQMSGELVIDRNTLEVRNARGRIAGAPGIQITQAQARIPDLHTSTTVVVSAEARGPLGDMLDVVNSSSLSALTGQILSKASASGNAELRLRLNLPVTAIERSKVQGSVTLVGNTAQLSPLVPALTGARGVVGFNESGIGPTVVQGRFLGGDVRIEGNGRPTTDNGARPPGGPGAAAPADVSAAFRIQGVVSAEGLREARELGGIARLAQSANGAAAYTAALVVRRGVPELQVSSNLQGMALGLPAPLGKTAEALLPVRFENSLLQNGSTPANASATAQKLQDQIVLEVGKLAAIAYQRDISGAQPRVLRGSVAMGLEQGESAPMPDEGVVANINLSRVDVDAWEAALSKASGVNIAQASSGRSASADPALAYLPNVIAVRASELVIEGRTLHRVVVGGSRDGLTWRANLDARELNGYVEYRQPGGAGAGRVYARLARMEIAQSTQTDIENTLDEPPANVPALDIVVEDLELRGKRLGRVEIEAVNRGAAQAQREGGVREWRLNRLNVSLPEGTLTASGNWAAVGATGTPGSGAASERRRTVMNFKLDVGNAGELLKRLGQPGVFRAGRGKLEGQVAWLGSPLALDYPSMGGQFNVNIENGQFLKADPGLAKLLGVLSLQSLPRRLALDFRDVFSDGFAFDFIRGDVRIDQGVANTNNMQMKGVNAGVLIDGKADIAKETQDLKVTVVPEINAGTASLFTTFINPAVGLGTFLAQLFLRRPLIAANTQEFHIDGSWVDPKMVKVERKLPTDVKPDTKPDAKLESRSETPAPAAQ